MGGYIIDNPELPDSGSQRDRKLNNWLLVAHNADGSLAGIQGLIIQDTDPGAVGAHKIWVSLNNGTFAMRNDTNTAWVFFSANAGGNLFIQDADPGAVGVDAVWVDFANRRIGIRNGTDTGWNFYTAGGGVGAIGSSGYGIGEYGNVPWDETVVNSSVLTTTPNLGLYKPMYATVGWGTWLNANMDKIEAFNVRLLAVEAMVP